MGDRDPRTAAELEARLEVLRGELSEIDEAYRDQQFPDQVKDRWNQLVEERDGLQVRLEEMAKRKAYLAQLDEPERSESVDDRWGDRHMALVDRAPEFSQAMKALDREVKRSTNFFKDGSEGRVIEEHLRSGDPMRLDARYVCAASSDSYRRAFAKYLAAGQQRMDFAELKDDERDAVRALQEIESLRAMQSGVQASGGYGVPISIDPSIRLSSASAVSPIRSLANVVQTSTREWRGVTSAGVTVQFGAEMGTAVEGTPTLAQPTVFAHRWHGWIPFSLEVEGDYPNLEDELLGVLADAKGSVESDKFLTGTGTNEPSGVLSGLTTSQRVQYAGTAWTAGGTAHQEAWYQLIGAVPDRFYYALPGGSEAGGLPGRRITAITSHRSSFDRAFKSDTDAAPAILPEMGGSLLGLRAEPWSNMNSGTAAGQKVAVAGSFQDAYLITDRVGTSAEVIPQLFSGTAPSYGAGRRASAVRVGPDWGLRDPAERAEVSRAELVTLSGRRGTPGAGRSPSLFIAAPCPVRSRLPSRCASRPCTGPGTTTRIQSTHARKRVSATAARGRSAT